MRLAFVLALVAASAACDLGKVTVRTTSKVLLRAQPALQQESDYELARQAIPGALKTVEGFWIVDPDNANLIRILTEGYCQYGIGFVEDDWEAAKLKQDLEAAEYHNDRATKMFTRCLNYALRSLGPRWQRDLFGNQDTVAVLLRELGGPPRRFAMMYAGVALGSLINHNLTRTEMLAYVPTVQQVLEHVLELDKRRPEPDLAHAALPHIALGMLHSGRPKALGGDPERARHHFEEALRITGNKFLLARTLMAIRIGLMINDRKFFHDQLKLVLETSPAVWPEQRLANEVAHRKARRYLSNEKELFQ
ncbi:MAG TPA: TRAP transporter TatT component family protein [Kofleriaceae bacterium]|nr:TRAP transporter TatT component family protein [Kofleriaceae bacterium]